ncbi:WXG100 family type VII secretion target [Paenibacillus wynnii]|uniref:WXG100 family type VII secretion target n=1 Tax=Paenibacillus wynnii TaxID=268407 RepID=UPI00278E7F3F|nr:WXG100 family type VII secretion target [Paenibacillus wynnii]MDQ0194708.1 WXG100 family type VII secretion target [Paenibacillus wynnii]
MAKIVVDPARLDSAAQKMDSQAAEYAAQYNKLFTEVNGMGSAWKGADNTAYVTQIQGFEDDFKNMHDLLLKYSDFLKQSAKLYRDTQNEIINSAKKLTN